MANRPKPRHLKLISGTSRRDRDTPADDDVGFYALEDAPDPPDWLPNAHAKAFFKQMAPVLMRMGKLTEANVDTFAQLCALRGKLVQLWNAGETPTGYLISQYRGLVNDFGLISVVSASARKIAAEPEKKSRFDRFKSPES